MALFVLLAPCVLDGDISLRAPSRAPTTPRPLEGLRNSREWAGPPHTRPPRAVALASVSLTSPVRSLFALGKLNQLLLGQKEMTRRFFFCDLVNPARAGVPTTLVMRPDLDRFALDASTVIPDQVVFFVTRGHESAYVTVDTGSQRTTQAGLLSFPPGCPSTA